MLAQGLFVADRYEIIGRIGAGGMSDVYKAKDHILGREVAIKILKQEFSEDATFVAKFRTEAQSAAGLEHPNIVNIYDVGSENGMYFIVMEYVEGITLKTYIEKKGQLNFKEAISIAIQVGRGIEAAHSKGIIHRDIKPQNIIISTQGKVKVTDFGIARATTSNTIHADVMGSVHYSSPEQARNGFVDGKSDIYSLGIVMYEMVTGRVPFDGDSTVAIAIQHLQEDMVAPSAYAPDLPIALEKIILKSTMKSPDKRYANISDLLMDLKKSLVAPYEDFVTIADDSLEKTRVITKEDQEQITNRAAKALYDDIASNNREPEEPVDEYFDEYDDDDYEDDDYDDWEDEDDNRSDRVMTILGVVVGIVIVIIVVIILGKVFGLFNFGSSDETDELADSANDTYTESVEEVPESKPEETASENKEEPKTEEKEEEEKDDKVAVPSVAGFTEADAKKALEGAGLVVTSTTKENSDNVPEGNVVSQSVAAGQSVPKNTNVTLVISQGPKEDTAKSQEEAKPENNGQTSYKFEYTNPEEDTIQCNFLGQTVKLDRGKKMAFTYNESSVDLTYTFTPSTTNEAGEIVTGEPKTVTVKLVGTAE